MTTRLPLKLFFAVLAGGLALLWLAIGRGGAAPAAFMAAGCGAVLFALNLGVLLFAGARLFAAAGGSTAAGASRSGRRGAALGALLFLKTALLAMGAYVVLVPLRLPAFAFVGGFGLGLAALIVATLVRAALRRRSAAPGAA